MADYNEQACKLRHESDERRISVVELALKEGDEKQEQRLTRIHQRFDEVSEQALKRLPAWVTIVIGLLSAMCAGLAVAAIK